MPPKPKLNTKLPVGNKRSSELPKASNSGNASPKTASGLSQEAEDQFELELCWCIQHLEICLATGKLPDKQVHDLNKNINILKSNNASLIKKRQIMRNTLGNYREKMALDEQKLGKTASSVKFMSPPTQNKNYIFVKKATATSTKEIPCAKSVTSMNSEENTTDNDNVQPGFKFNFQIQE